MLAPENGFFVDGNPTGGTIVSAAFMNAVLGEFQALLALQGVALNEAGGLPQDHRQVADLLAVFWLRVQTAADYPSSAPAKTVILDPDELLAGNWPFRIWNNGAWETPETPLGSSDDGGDGGGDGGGADA
ncbi:MAG: hypothetical protein F6K42_27400, partial [Leptolyngbya sp. SIO1D8]|nr:hypothetical protein [Leptolyngbya sp. SIO1D8]